MNNVRSWMCIQYNDNLHSYSKQLCTRLCHGHSYLSIFVLAKQNKTDLYQRKIAVDKYDLS